MPNIRGKTWTEGDFFTPTDAQFFEDHLYDGGGGGGGASWGAISGNIQNQTDLIDYIDEHSGGSASWGSITGTIENQTDLVEYIATHGGGGGGGAAWGSITGNIESQTDLINYISAHGGGGGVFGIDTSNIIANVTNASSAAGPQVTLPADIGGISEPVIVFINGTTQGTTEGTSIPTLNGVPLFKQAANNLAYPPFQVVIFPNDELKFRLMANGKYMVFGIRKG